MKIKGVSINGILYTSGFPCIRRSKYSSISIGKCVRMLNLQWMNAIGLNHRCLITTEKNATLILGDNVGMSGVSIWCFKKIVVDNNVRIGANVLITDGDAHLDDPRSREPKPVHICDNVWLGMNVTILKGVTIGKNSLIGAGSIVTKDIPENVIAAGNPCKVVRHLELSVLKDLEA